MRLFPVLGAGFGSAVLELASTQVPPERFEAVLADPQHDAALSSWALVLHAGFTTHVWSSGHGDLLGLSVGALLTPIATSWKRRGVDVFGGPAPPVSGAYFAIALAFEALRRDTSPGQRAGEARGPCSAPAAPSRKRCASPNAPVGRSPW